MYNIPSRLRFFESILKRDLGGMDDAVAWLEERTDSQLETLFCLALLSVYRESGEAPPELAFDLGDDHIRLAEPFAFSPTSNGVSTAFLCAQKDHGGRLWDFAIYTANDNGAQFPSGKLSTLIDVDGFNVHREQRAHDLEKSASSDIRALRVCEELFTSVEQMATAALYGTVWTCECWGSGKCSVCETLLSRLR